MMVCRIVTSPDMFWGFLVLYTKIKSMNNCQKRSVVENAILGFKDF